MTTWINVNNVGLVLVAFFMVVLTVSMWWFDDSIFRNILNTVIFVPFAALLGAKAFPGLPQEKIKKAFDIFGYLALGALIGVVLAQ